jgi:hypothetical protein
MVKVEAEVRKLLDETRAAAEPYASAQYRRPGETGRRGLTMRLEAIEEALVLLARAVDSDSK